MAYTKIKPIRNHLNRCLNYTINPEKTEMQNLSKAELAQVLHYTQNQDKTEQQFFVSAFNCTPERASEMMMQTKERWGKNKKGNVLAYHVIQSFQPGEVTPQQAHAIGCELACRVLADYFEVTVSTHLDCKHLHNHLVFNSVSYLDGRMYRDDFKGYYGGIRKVSDEICKEYQLSVIQPQAKGRSYAEWQADKQAKPTMRSMIRSDVERALEKAISWETFVLTLQRMGYQVKWGPNVTHAALRHVSGSKHIRLRSLGEQYTEEAIRRRLQQRRSNRPATESPVQQRKYSTRQRPHKIRKRAVRSWRKTRKIGGFMGLYYHYLYLLSKAKRKQTSRRCYYLLRDEFRKFERYCKQCDFLWSHRIETQAQLQAVQHQIQQQMEQNIQARKQCYIRRKSAADPEKHQRQTQQITQINQTLRQLRTQYRICEAICQDAQTIQQNRARMGQPLQQTTKEVNQYEQRR